MKYFVSSDIHGFFDEWMHSLIEKGFDVFNQDHKIIVCGDLFDRGRQPKQIIDYILKNKDKFILVRGNHEDLMEEMIKRNRALSHDIHNGTINTIIDLGEEAMSYKFDFKKIAIESGLEKILSLFVDFFETGKYIFIHGGIPINLENSSYNPNWRNAQKEDWNKARWLNPLEMYKKGLFELGKTIVCGHWHCSAFWASEEPKRYDEFGPLASFDPYIRKGIMAIDTCTAYSQKVNVVIVED